MDLITATLILLAGIVVSGWIVSLLPVPVPQPLVQIALGLSIASVADLHLVLPPETFFLLFLPPLLFLEAWRIPKNGLLQDGGTILALAIGLVVLTVVGVGYFLSVLVPSIPLGVAFALAAVLAPTDPVAVTSIAARTPVPRRLMNILEGESLFNDASGLVCMRIAVAAVVSGTFSLPQAVGTFAWVGLGGVLIGVAVTLAVTRAKTWIASRLGEDAGSQILISLLLPFGAYLLAERMSCSGILAAVGAGIAMSYVEQSGHAQAVTRMRRAAVWDTLHFTANGVVFILLGMQVAPIVEGATTVIREIGQRPPVWLLIYIAATTAALMVLRFVWAWVTLQIMVRNAKRAGWDGSLPTYRLAGATALAGVRGAITMAGIQTLPLVLATGAPFPARDLAVCIAAGVIVLSLVVAAIGLPLVLYRIAVPEDGSPSDLDDEERARTIAARAGMRAVEKALTECADNGVDAGTYADASVPILRHYRQRIALGSEPAGEAEHLRLTRQAERDLRLAGIRAERDAVFNMARTKELSHHTARKLVFELDLVETRLASS